MKQKWVKLLSGFGILALTLAGCSKDKDEVSNEEELITTVSLRFQEVGSPTNTFVVTFRDIDGEGGNPPSIEEIILKPNANYSCSVELLNESVSPAEDITEEVQEEANDHELYFIPAGANITINRVDLDSRSLPVGLSSTWQTGAASTGTVRVVLKHKPGIKAAGDPVTKGETDIDLNFTTKVQ
ncbi:MAG: hypothetical protein MUE38_08795 [Flavihumibacter sp.]|jgi:hypothetical protein|nr:hypothetical protein [Flavihumibacter sp.]